MNPDLDTTTPSSHAATDGNLRVRSAGLELDSLVKLYGTVAAVDELCLTVKAGEFVTLLGPSGSGKSTTLSMVAGFETPTSGRIKLGDRDITALATHKRDLGMVFQGYALFPHMTVFDNVAFPLKLRGVPRKEILPRVSEALAVVDLNGYEDRRPSQLSGGQQQRVSLARAFVHRPPILLMDEPLSALDKNLRMQMQLEMRRLHRELGTTVLYVTHDQEEALGLSDRIVVMRNGRIEQVATPEEIYQRPVNRFVAGFLGEANFVEVRGFASGADGLWSGSTSSGQVLRGSLNGSLAMPPADARAVLRPEDASVAPWEGVENNTCPVIPIELVYLGDRIRCVVRFNEEATGMVWLSLDEAARVQLGTEIRIHWPVPRTGFVTQ